MPKGKFDKKVTKVVLKSLDTMARKYGLAEIRHAANKWVGAQRDKASLSKARAELEKRLAEVNRRLAR